MRISPITQFLLCALVLAGCFYASNFMTDGEKFILPKMNISIFQETISSGTLSGVVTSTGNAKKQEKNAIYEEINSFTGTRNTVNEITSKIDIKVPFFSQAPNGWTSVTEETCENASLLNAINYLGQLKYTQNIYYGKLLELEDYKLTNFKSNSITMSQLKGVGEKFFPGFKYTIVKIKDLNELKKYINEKSLVLFPAKGKTLNNPYYSNGGPDYHVMVVRGYDDTSYITNDVGTKRGDGYVYSNDILSSSLRDYNGERNVLVVSSK